MRPGGALLAAALAVSLALEAAADDGRRRWIAVSGPQVSSLMYGTPDSDDVHIGFTCRRATRQITVAFAHEPVGAKDGMRLGIELWSEGGRVMLDAAGRRMQLDDLFVLEATTTLSPALRRILTEGKTLSVMVQDGVEEIPLEGAARAAAGLMEACG
jgi:hypothetical protein